VTTACKASIGVSTPHSKQRSCMQVNGMLLEGKKVYVGPFVKRQDRPEGSEVRFTNVFVKNLADSVTEEVLEGLFSKYGTVTSVVIMKVTWLPRRCAVSFIAREHCNQHTTRSCRRHHQLSCSQQT
jgi:RNA recognition motif. (a.k.a. RRM, RBD, or RNP domain)